MSANAIAQDIERVSVNALGLEANFDSQSPSISADGRLVAFMSSSSNLVVDTNNASDVFVYIESGRIFGSSFEGPD